MNESLTNKKVLKKLPLSLKFSIWWKSKVNIRKYFKETATIKKHTLRNSHLEKLYIIAKLEGYGFHVDTLKLIHNYLTNRKQKVKVSDPYNS